MQYSTIASHDEQPLHKFRFFTPTSTNHDHSRGGDISAVAPLIEAYLGLLPEKIDMMEVRSKTSEELRKDPYVIVSFQESDRMNILLDEIKRSFLELELGTIKKLRGAYDS